MRLVLMGPPACGKGTIAKMLSDKLNIPTVSVGDVLRQVPADFPDYNVINEHMGKGLLVPNTIVGALLTLELSKPIYANGYILDGWLRQISDKDCFDPNADFVIYIKISDKTSINRISGRRICEEDGKIYNIYTLPQETLKEMLLCKTLVHREDDKEEVVKARLVSFYEQTMPVIKYFEGLNKILEVDGEGSPDEVFNLVLHALDITQ
ncbi:nucleoside monophosphate kinase [candidate division WWE3 bacterium]|nr:nucleoside monophosphate kinase [candidate division WWE3 bacterium]